MSKTGKGFQIEYPSITLHAVSRGDTSPSLYCQLDESSAKVMKMAVDEQPPATNGKPTGETDAEGDEEAEEEDEMAMRELNIIPKRVEARACFSFSGSSSALLMI